MARPKPKSKPQSIVPVTTKRDVQLAEVKAKQSGIWWDRAFGFLRTLTRCATVAFACYIFYLSVKELAGRETIVVALLDVAAKIDLDRWVFLTIGVLGGGGYVLQKRANKKLVRDTAEHIRKLEAVIDPDRTSSRLLGDGTPNKEDSDGA